MGSLLGKETVATHLACADDDRNRSVEGGNIVQQPPRFTKQARILLHVIRDRTEHQTGSSEDE
jgi:hypothetical protein